MPFATEYKTTINLDENKNSSAGDMLSLIEKIMPEPLNKEDLLFFNDEIKPTEAYKDFCQAFAIFLLEARRSEASCIEVKISSGYGADANEIQVTLTDDKEQEQSFTSDGVPQTFKNAVGEITKTEKIFREKILREQDANYLTIRDQVALKKVLPLKEEGMPKFRPDFFQSNPDGLSNFTNRVAVNIQKPTAKRFTPVRLSPNSNHSTTGATPSSESQDSTTSSSPMQRNTSFTI